MEIVAYLITQRNVPGLVSLGELEQGGRVVESVVSMPRDLQ